MTRKKYETMFNIECSNNSSNNNLNTSEAHSFIQSIIDNFKQGTYCLLEAMRIVNAKDKHKELDLILHDEEHSTSYKINQLHPFK